VVASNLYLDVCTVNFFLFLMKYALSAFPTKITYAKVNYDKALTSERAPTIGTETHSVCDKNHYAGKLCYK
jgi:hypothetical protein